MLGYTARQAQFLVRVVLHGGYFLRRQSVTFTGTRQGQATVRFLARCVARDHVRVLRYGRDGDVFHPSARLLYAAIGEEDNRHSLVSTLMFRLAPIVALRRARRRCQGRGGRAGRGARSARNLDAAEHARTMTGRSERSHSRAAWVDVLRPPTDFMQSRTSVLQLRITTRGSDVPAGTNVDRSWVDVLDGRGRRSPLVSRPERRPRPNAEQGRSCWRNCK